MRISLRSIFALVFVAGALLAIHLERKRAFIDGYNRADAKHRWFWNFYARHDQSWEALRGCYLECPQMTTLRPAHEEFGVPMDPNWAWSDQQAKEESTDGK